jgi:hypothetical protein
MKKWFIVMGILAFLFVGGYFVLTFYAVKFIQPYVQKVMGSGLTFVQTRIRPTHLSVMGIQFEDPHSRQRFFKVNEVRIYPSLSSLLTNSLRIKEITILEPSIFFYRSREGGIAGPFVMATKQGEKEEVSEKEDRKKKQAIQVQIDRIRIEEGSVNFEDQKVAAPPAQIKLRELNFEMRDIQYPLVSLRSPIELRGKINGQAREGSVHVKGWIDAKTMNLEISLKMQEIEVKTFEPYYRKRVTAEIESGMMNMDSKIAVKEKRIDAPGEMDLIDLRVKKGGGMVLWIPAETLSSLLERKGNQIKAKFHVKGDMENAQFSLQEIFLTQMAFSFARALGFPVRVIGEEGPQGASGGEKGLLEGIQSIKEQFKKKKEKRRQ